MTENARHSLGGNADRKTQHLSTICSQIVLKCLYFARIGRLHLLWFVNKLAGASTKWIKSCDKRLARLICEDNKAVIKMIINGRSPAMRHVSRTHRVALDWLCNMIDLDPKIQIRYIDTKKINSQTFWLKGISHVMSGTMSFICLVSAISAPLATSRISAWWATSQWRRGFKIKRKKKELCPSRDQQWWICLPLLWTHCQDTGIAKWNWLYGWYKRFSRCWISTQKTFPRYQSTSVFPTSSRSWWNAKLFSGNAEQERWAAKHFGTRMVFRETFFANPPASSSAPYPQESNPWSSNLSEHTSPHVMSQSQTPARDQRCQSGPLARNCKVNTSKDPFSQCESLQGFRVQIKIE